MFHSVSSLEKFIISLLLFSEKCGVLKYDVKMQSYGILDVALGLMQFRQHIYPEIKADQIKDEQWLIIFYDSTDVIHYQQIPIRNFWGFVSAAGGSLGLFLGFSCYSVLSYCNDCIKAKLETPSKQRSEPEQV